MDVQWQRRELSREECELVGAGYVPNWVRFRPPFIGYQRAVLPCCWNVHEIPEATTGTCPACDEPYWIWECPDEAVRVLDLEAKIEVHCLRSEQNVLEQCIAIEVYPPGTDVEAERSASRAMLRAVARNRVLHTYGRGPAIDAQGRVIPGTWPSPRDVEET